MKASEYLADRFRQAGIVSDYPTGKFIGNPDLERRILALLEAVEALRVTKFDHGGAMNAEDWNAVMNKALDLKEGEEPSRFKDIQRYVREHKRDMRRKKEGAK